MHASFLRTVAAAAAAVVAFALPAAAFAAPGGVRIIVTRWTPTNPAVQSNDIVLDRPALMSDALNQGWADARKPVCQTDRATSELRRASELARRQGDLPTARAADSTVMMLTSH